MRAALYFIFIAVLLALPVPAFAAEAVAAGNVREPDEGLPRPLKDQPADYYAALARVHGAYGLYKEAEILQQKAIELETDRRRKEALSHELFDRIYCRAAWWDKAADEILRTLDLADPADESRLRSYHLDRAQALNEAGRPDEYIAELETVIRLSQSEEERARSLRALHAGLLRLDRLTAQLDAYEAAVRENPKDVETLRILAGIYYGNGVLNKPARAIEKYEQLVAADAGDVEANEQLARLYSETADTEKALDAYERLLALNPKRSDASLTDAVNLVRASGRDDAAIAWCSAMAERFPKEPGVLIRLGDIHSENQQFEQAAGRYKTAIPLIESYMDQLPVYLRLIDSQLSAERYAEAEASCREALKLDIRSSTLRARLEELLQKARAGQEKKE